MGAETAADREPSDVAPLVPRRGVSAGEAIIIDSLRALTAEVRLLREKAPSPKLLIGGAIAIVLVVFGIQSATTIYVISGLLATRGVDLGQAADATKKVVDAGKDVAPAAAGSSDNGE